MAETYYSLTDIVKLLDNLVASMPSDDMWGILTVRNSLWQIPATDVVEVVRCKDCKWAIPENEKRKMFACFGALRKPNWFCAYGEKREADNVR